MLARTSLSRHFRSGLLVTTVALAACGGPEPKDVEKPTPPDMTLLAAAYAAPDGVLTEETAAEAYDAAYAIFDSVSALGIDQTLIDTVLDAIEAKQSGETESQGA